MNKIAFIAFFCLQALLVSAQISTLHVKSGCAFDDQPSESDLYLYEPSDEAEHIVNEILDALGLEKNFALKSSNVPNALATTLNGTRFILYSTDFLEKFKADANSQWAAYSVMAHEIGHHLNGHNFAETDPRTRKMLELEAEQFAGSVLRMLGASITEAQAGLGTNMSGETNTHPPIAARKEAVCNGWKKRDEWLKARGIRPEKKIMPAPAVVAAKTEEPKFDEKTIQAIEWFEKGNKEFDVNKQIACYNQAIIFKPNYAEAYLSRGNSKFNMSQYADAIADYDKAIQINPEYYTAYKYRGVAKNKLEKFAEAILDFDKVVALNKADTYLYYSRASAKKALGKVKEAIEDYDISIQLEPMYSSAFSERGLLKVISGNNAEGFADLNKAIQLDKKNLNAYNNRGRAYLQLNKYQDAINDFDSAIQLDESHAISYLNKGGALVKSGRYCEAIESLNKSLRLDKTLTAAREYKAEVLKELAKD